MKLSKFQLIVLAIFVLGIIGGVIAFARYKSNASASQFPPITVWGTFPKSVFDQYLTQVNDSLSQQISVTYVQETEPAFYSDFVSALARGQGPDAVLIPADMLLPNEDKLQPIPYTALPQRTFMDSFIQEGSIYLTSNGVMGVPFAIDPLIMYWNRDMFNAAGLATYPKYWDDFTTIIPKIDVRTQDGTVSTSAIAMGDFTNVDNARELLGSLIMQLGNPVTAESGGTVGSEISLSAPVSPVPALQFFTRFVNPSDPDYSWNRSWPDSKSAFLAGDLATYFGFASELSDIRAKNPNLNFDAAPLPQDRSGGVAATYGKLYGFSIVKASPNQNAAFQIISMLTEPQYLVDISDAMYLPSVDLSIIQSGSTDPYIGIFDQSALISRTWLDADPAASTQIFGSMVQAVTSGQKTTDQAVQDAGAQYNAALQQASAQ